MTQLLLIRHGETDWARQGILQGQTDTPLTPHGRVQAERLRERLAPWPLDAIYCSDLRRSLNTALLIAGEAKDKVRPCPQLRELHFGQAEGLTFAQVQQRFPEVARHWLERSPELAYPGGEGLGDFFHRTSAFFQELRERHPRGRVAVVGHGGSLRWGLCFLLGWQEDAWWQCHLALASLSIVELSPSPARLVLLNDTSYLEGLEWQES